MLKPHRPRPQPSLEEILRVAIAAATQAHGQRAALSRQLGHPRGWLSEYVTGKVKHLKIDELAALLSVLSIDADSAQLTQLRAVMMGGEGNADIVTLFRLWNAIAPAHRPAALREVERVAKLSAEIQRLTDEVHRADAGKSSTASGAARTPAAGDRRPSPRGREGGKT